LLSLSVRVEMARYFTSNVCAVGRCQQIVTVGAAETKDSGGLLGF